MHFAERFFCYWCIAQDGSGDLAEMNDEVEEKSTKDGDYNCTEIGRMEEWMGLS